MLTRCRIAISTIGEAESTGFSQVINSFLLVDVDKYKI